MSIIDMITIKF